MTRQRRVVLEELRKVRSHPTADEVYRLVRRRLPRVSLGTVYRTLDLLARRGAIQRFDAVGRGKRFDAFVEPHCHVACLRCGRVADLPFDAPATLAREAARISDYAVQSCRMVFSGLCPGCRQRSAAKAASAGEEHA